jgi:hypothetical protein
VEASKVGGQARADVKKQKRRREMELKKSEQESREKRWDRETLLAKSNPN